ncbi:MAG TPA: CDP-diacylglycerol--glycerol-3-phosphate 3-phosphatidyltransferase [Planctomycetota bacterium]|nr:CDP-diacylglycerol--glycerol-3-phosphate 3-phosphatidyltransferase [Planctomycetota bacterium]
MPFFRFNWPNRITMARLVASVALFWLIAIFPKDDVPHRPLAIWTLALFVLVAGTDWLDGFLARRLGQVTTFGRIFDPFVDKVAVCGAFIMLLRVRPVESVLETWMVTVIVGREFFVNSIRGYMESRGVDFGAAAPGKVKMLLQCVCVGFLLGRVAFGNLLDSLETFTSVLLWATVFVTVASGVYYTHKAFALIRAADG